ncbi:MAG: hypothetical protein FJ308_22075, partial [Planctomycetes bacterium]|nr:hypothetical protein [Planctomycetota bacterium]
MRKLIVKMLAGMVAGTSWGSIVPATAWSQPPAESVDESLPSGSVAERDIEPSGDEEVMDSRWSMPLPTLGGKQFWTDHR